MIKSFLFENFKSFGKTEFTIGTFSTLIGSNASGKTNAIEGMKILSELSTGRECSVILDGSKNLDSGIRGGGKGCCRFHMDSFKLGCRVPDNDAFELLYEVEIEVGARILVKEESLRKIDLESQKEQMVFRTKETSSDFSDIKVEYNNGKRGKNPDVTCIRNASILSQMKTKMPSDKSALQENLRSIELVTNNLLNILFLDPLPKEMRDYVRSTDKELKVNCENISAVLKELCKDSKRKETLLDIIRNLPENEIEDISFVDTSLGDVLFTLKEVYGRDSELVDAKRLSDGTLRCIAVVTAVLTAPNSNLLVIEEIDNGIHPGRVRSLVDRLSQLARERGIGIIITTHNSVVLNGLSKENLKAVSVIYREKDGTSSFVEFIHIDQFPKLLARGGLGDAMLDDSLLNLIKGDASQTPDYSWMGV